MRPFAGLSWLLSPWLFSSACTMALKDTSWSVTEISVDGSLTSVEDDANVLAVLRFQEYMEWQPGDTYIPRPSLQVVFAPCPFSMEMPWQVTSDQAIEITDNSEECPECTTPDQWIEQCFQISSTNYTTQKAMGEAFVSGVLGSVSYQLTDDATGLELLDDQASATIRLESCSQMAPGLEGTHWYASEIHTPDGETIRPVEVLGKQSVTARFNQCTIVGSAACNGYSGDYKVLDATNKMILNGISSTLMACDEPRNSMELAYHQALRQVSTFDLEDQTQLTVLDENGDNLITFLPCSRMDPMEKHLQSWGVGNVGRNTGDKPLVMVLGRDNVMTGSTPCSKSYSVPYEMDMETGSMTIFVEEGEWPSLDLCNPNDFEEGYQYDNAILVESEFKEALKHIESFETVPCSDTLVLRDADDFPQLSFSLRSEQQSGVPNFDTLFEASPESGATNLNVTFGWAIFVATYVFKLFA